MVINTVQEILNKLNVCMVTNKPFSLLRYGDGGLKFMRAVIKNSEVGLNLICKKEGLPENNFKGVLKLWIKYANQADYIDCPQVYFDGFFWPRIKKTNKEPISSGTLNLLNHWKKMYELIGITNENYCNPEFNYLCCIKREDGTSNLIEVIKRKKIAFITACPKAVLFLKENGLDVDLFHIVKQYEDHYNNSFHHIIHDIKEKAQLYDVWLVSAGELGRIYSGLIKEMGGRAVDMGFMAEVWAGGTLNQRLRNYVSIDPKDKLYLKIQMEGRRFLEYI